MKKYSLLFVLNMLPGKFTGALTFSFMKIMSTHPPFTASVSFLTVQAVIIFSGFDFILSEVEKF